MTALIPSAIEVDDLVKSYGQVDAVRGVFTVPPREVFGFLGPNGAATSSASPATARRS